jgi:DNA-binding NarL/FixJ family response regulator
VTTVFSLAGNRLLRDALARLLAKRSDLVIVGTGAHGEETLKKISSCMPDIMLSDRADVDAIEAIQFLSRQNPGLKVILIGMPDDQRTFLNAIRAGVVGYVLSDASAMEIIGAVRSVARGDAVCPPHLLPVLFQYVRQEPLQSSAARVGTGARLTRREQQLIPLIAEGLTNKEIASQLNLSEQTIKNHIHRMLQKAGADDRYGIVKLSSTHVFLGTESGRMHSTL